MKIAYDTETNENEAFQKLLSNYLITLYQVTGIIPSSTHYRDRQHRVFPLVIVTDHNEKAACQQDLFKEQQQKVNSGKYKSD